MLAFELSNALLKFALAFAEFGLPAFGLLDLRPDGEEQR
jgi:hypothetical protein